MFFFFLLIRLFFFRAAYTFKYKPTSFDDLFKGLYKNNE